MVETIASHAISACSAGGSGVTSQAAGTGGSSDSILPVLGMSLAGVMAAAGVLFLAAILIGVIVALATRPPRALPVAVPVYARISPDGYYWWDGTSWRARISPDGYHWWDGTSWRLRY